MVPRCIFMQPNAIRNRGCRSTTYIQNNFYGGGKPQNIWGCSPYRVTMSPMYYQPPMMCGGFFSWAPPYVQNAVTRFAGFSLINALFNMGKNNTTVQPQTQLLTNNNTLTNNEGVHATNDELNEVNTRYNA